MRRIGMLLLFAVVVLLFSGRDAQAAPPIGLAVHGTGIVCNACILCSGYPSPSGCSIVGAGCTCPSNLKKDCYCSANTSGCYALCYYTTCAGVYKSTSFQCAGGCSECWVKLAPPSGSKKGAANV